MSKIGADPDPLARCVVVVRRHLREYGVAALKAQRVQEIRAAKYPPHDFSLHGGGIVMDDIIGAQQEFTRAITVDEGGFGQRPAPKRAFHHPGAADAVNVRTGKRRLADKFGHKPGRRAVVQRMRIGPLVQGAAHWCRLPARITPTLSPSANASNWS